ncbi:MAG: metallophosphoesterase family protein [Promethearchaeota archaeon]
MPEIVHISDLHIGSQSFRKKYLTNVLEYINHEVKNDLVVCTGDVTNGGRVAEFKKARKYFDQMEVPLLCVPGNRDAKRNGLYFYEKFFGPRISKHQLQDATILALNSAISDMREGYLGNFQLHWIANQLKEAETPNKVLALHHHLIPVPDAGREMDTIMDAGDVLEMTQMFKCTLVLCGDRHVPYAWVIGPTTFVYAGTCSSKKVRGDEDPSFNHISISSSGDDLEVHTVSSVSLEKTLLIKRVAGRTKFVRHRKTRIEHLLNSDLYQPLD